MDIAVYPDEGWAEAVADLWADRLRTNPALVMCLPTGATPRPVYHAIAQRDDVGFQRARVFLPDEFGELEEDDPARCDVMMRTDLLDHIDLPSASFHRPDPTASDLDAEASRYSAAVRSAGLGLTMLGLGGNGHVALNEPGSARHSTARVVDLAPPTVAGALAYGARRPPRWGLTLGLEELLSSDEVWLLVTGAHKAEILARALQGPVGADCPASWLQEHPRATALVDQSATEVLSTEY